MTHQKKKLDLEELKKFRDTLELPIPDKKIAEAPFFHPGMESPEVRYLLDRRRALGGSVPGASCARSPMPPAGAKVFAEFEGGTGENPGRVTTMVFGEAGPEPDPRPAVRPARSCPSSPTSAHVRHGGAVPRGRHLPAVRSEVRPGGFEARPLLHEKQDGQLLEEGITEAGSTASFTAAGTAYATHGTTMIPFYIFYSMFGFQRTMDLIWAFGDARGRGFLLGATAGRTTLNGEDCSTRTATATCSRARCQLRALRPGVRIRGGHDRQGRPAPHVRAGRGRLLLHHALQTRDYSMPPKPRASTRAC